MSAPSYTFFMKEGKEQGKAFCNFGWASPSDYDVALYLIKVASYRIMDITSFGHCVMNPILDDWDTIIQRHYGTISRERFVELHNHVGEIYLGKRPKNSLNLGDYFTPHKETK